MLSATMDKSVQLETKTTVFENVMEISKVHVITYVVMKHQSPLLQSFNKNLKFYQLLREKRKRIISL